ncbi:ABC transporter substrate-binding protein [Photobacterium sanctipauli]|uniref:ABC transporter substrate-binding protein n=1 Tax=Photobacterium sanctipauli TaxID=1342794 RepID=A0A2T3NVQ3_9GAMM|nr:ABC transporter substrate-binding protein [Photobacterium sanctipauli]
MKVLGICCLLAGALLSSWAVSAKDILTAAPVTYMLSTELTKGTGLETHYLPPKRYGLQRLPNWFASKGVESVEKAAQTAKAAITLGAVWPQDPLYAYARQSNIQIVEIDASQSISPRATGVAALQLDDGSTSPYAWLNPTNLTRMTAIVSGDLQRLWPQHAEVIAANQQALMINVRHLINQQQAALFEAEVDSVILLSKELEDFAAGNQLFVVDRLTKPELEWTEQDKTALVAMLKEDEATWILTSKRVSKMLKALVPKPERILVVDSIDRWGSKGINQQAPLARWELNL